MLEEPRREVGTVGSVAVCKMVGEAERREEKDGNVRMMEGGDKRAEEWADVEPVILLVKVWKKKEWSYKYGH